MADPNAPLTTYETQGGGLLNQSSTVALDPTDPSFIYKNAQQLEQERIDAANAAAQAAAGKKKGKIICQQYHTLGILSDELNILDQAYGAWLMKTNRKWQQGYLRYAKHIVKHLHRDSWKGRLLIAVLTPLVHVWSQEMGYRMGGNYKHSILGSFLMWLMVRVFMTLNSVRVIGLRIKSFFRKRSMNLATA